MKSKFEIKEGNEIRGFRIRLYPTIQEIEVLSKLEDDLRYVWNVLVGQTEDVIIARQAYAIRNNLVSKKPSPPIYDGLQPKEAKNAKEKYIKEIRDWHHDVYVKTNKIPECGFRKLKDIQNHFNDKQDYQLMKRIISWKYPINPPEIGASIFQALVRNFFTTGKNQRRKKFRKKSDPMPLQIRSRKCFRLGDFGKRRGNNFYNCQISFHGMQIKGRLPGKSPEGRVLEGVSIRREADGWWASVKVEVPIRNLSPAIKGTSVGIDVGLDNVAVIYNGKTNLIVENPRGKEYVKLISERQAKKIDVGRLCLQANRNVEHLIYNEIVKPLANYELIIIEELNSKIGQMGSAKISVMRKIAFLLKQRYGDRVREVDCRYTSQDCSQCGYRSKESWSYDNGPIGQCTRCGYKEHRDANAARNIRSKGLISMGSEVTPNTSGGAAP